MLVSFSSRFMIMFLVGCLSLLSVSATPTLVHRKGKPLWLGPHYVELLTAEDKTVFSTLLTGLKIGAKIHNKGRNNYGTYHVETFNGHPGNGLFLKVLEMADDNAYAEVKALHAKGDLVAAGSAQDMAVSVTKVPVIVMKLHNGVPIKDSPAFKSEKDAQKKQKMADDTLQKACDLAAEEAVSKGILHDDLNPTNVLVDIKGTTVSVALIDYGHDIMAVKGTPKKEEVSEYLMKKWQPRWKNLDTGSHSSEELMF